MSKKIEFYKRFNLEESQRNKIRVIRKKIQKKMYTTPLLKRLSNPRIGALYLEISSKCNLSCVMCTYKKEHESTGFMPFSLFTKCMDEAGKMHAKEVCLHFGGESLVNPNFKQYLKYAVENRDSGGIEKVSWIDNGMLFNPDIADLVVELKVDAIGFSIDGIGFVNDSIRLGAKYSVIEKNIKYLLEKRDEKPEVFLSMCSYGKTEDQLMDVYRAWVPYVDRITLIPQISSDNTIDNKENYLEGAKIAAPPPFCPYPFEIMAISWDGKVTGCCLDYAFRLNLGNASKQSLSEIWHGSQFNSLRNNALKDSFPMNSPCYKCEFWKINFKSQRQEILNGDGEIYFGYIYKTIKKSNDKTTHQ